jgi:hypothetical protein
MAQPSKFDYDFWRFVVQIIGYVGGWGLIVTGWIVTSRQSLERERRKELRARIDEFIEDIEEIEKNAIAFYQSEPGSEKVGEPTSKMAIVGAVGKLSRGLQRLKKAQNVNAVTQIIRFRKSITGGDFDSKDRHARDNTDPVLHTISVSALELVEQLESEYDRIHP